MVEVGQLVTAAAVQGAAELGQFFQSGGYSASEGVDDAGEQRLAATPVGVAVGGDDALVDAPGHMTDM